MYALYGPQHRKAKNKVNVPGYTILNNNQSIYNESYESTECSESK